MFPAALLSGLTPTSLYDTLVEASRNTEIRSVDELMRFCTHIHSLQEKSKEADHKRWIDKAQVQERAMRMAEGEDPRVAELELKAQSLYSRLERMTELAAKLRNHIGNDEVYAELLAELDVPEIEA